MTLPGDTVLLPLTVIRIVDGRLDGRTADGQLVQTRLENIAAPAAAHSGGTDAETEKRNGNVGQRNAGAKSAARR